MTGLEFRIALHKALAPWAHARPGWADQDLLAERLGIQQSSVQRWCSGVNPVPEHVAAWVRELAALAPKGDPAVAYWAVLHALPKGWANGGDNERDKRDKHHATDRAGADAGQRD